MLRVCVLEYLSTPATPKLPDGVLRVMMYCTYTLTLADSQSLRGHILQSLWPTLRNPATSKRRPSLMLSGYRLNMRK